jgi:hypothetical protein
MHPSVVDAVVGIALVAFTCTRGALGTLEIYCGEMQAIATYLVQVLLLQIYRRSDECAYRNATSD